MSLKHIEINIWKACNNKCRFCMSSNSELWDIKFVEFEKLKNKLINYYNNWYNSIWFLWWDISIYPHIEELIHFCKEIGFIEIHVITNWMLFSNYDFAKRIVTAWLTRINISIHSHLSEIEDYLTQVPWWFHRKVLAINNFNKLYKEWLLISKVSANIVLNQRNYKTILETILFFNKKLLIGDIRINFIWLDDMIKENWNDLKLSYTEFLPYLKKLIYVSLKENIRITFDTIPACIFYKVDSKNYYNVIKRFLWENLDHITEIDWSNNNTNFNWQEKKKNLLKTQFNQCNQCLYNSSCQWVRKEYWELYWWDEFYPILNDNKFTIVIDSDKSWVINKDLVIKKVIYWDILKAYKNDKYIILYVYSNEDDSKIKHFSKFLIKIIFDIHNNFNIIWILFWKDIDLAWVIKNKCLYDFSYNVNNISWIVDYTFSDNKWINKLSVYGKFSTIVEDDILDYDYLSNLGPNGNLLTLTVLKGDVYKYDKNINYAFAYQPCVWFDQYTFIVDKNSCINWINYRFIQKDVNISISINKITYFFINIDWNDLFLMPNEVESIIIKSDISINIINEYNRELALDLELKILDFRIFLKWTILAKYYDNFH